MWLKGVIGPIGPKKIEAKCIERVKGLSAFNS